MRKSKDISNLYYLGIYTHISDHNYISTLEEGTMLIEQKRNF
jgi:hypothetical protein